MRQLDLLPLTDVIYLAGYFDGEGCVRIKNEGNYYFIRVAIAGIDPRPLKQAKKMFGGSLRLRYPKHGRPTWYWELGHNKAHNFLLTIFPYLIVKSEEVQVALEFHKKHKKLGTRGRGKGRKAITKKESQDRKRYQIKITELKQRIWMN
jgi:hypothetical protein